LLAVGTARLVRKKARQHSSQSSPQAATGFWIGDHISENDLLNRQVEGVGLAWPLLVHLTIKGNRPSQITLRGKRQKPIKGGTKCEQVFPSDISSP